ncbi:MAG: hypothetical protein K2X27_15375 [Candidatus Obscuribacterales bacterium]|nr:hypothetical protein [Candidatus Obscuribacterales bacterium]
MKSKQPQYNLRSESGTMGMLIPGTVLLMIIGVGAFSADIAHNVSVRTQLQSATDAAALAGAAALIDPETAPMASYRATQVAGMNSADGVPVSATTPNTTVAVSINTNVPGEIGTCEVTASQPVQNWLASIFGHGSDTITVTSTAAASKTVSSIAGNIMFPLAVSIDAIPTTKSGSQLPLGKLQPGQTVNIYINSQQVKNGAFTSFGVKNTNANWLNDAIDQGLGFTAPQSNFIPPVQMGEPIFLDNGVAGQKKLAGSSRLNALKGKDHIVLPVIEGTPPFNQSQPIIGWVVVKVTNVTVNQSGGQVETIAGTITHAAVRGKKGDIFGVPSNPSANSNLTAMSPSNVRLIENVAH